MDIQMDEGGNICISYKHIVLSYGSTDAVNKFIEKTSALVT